MAAPSSEVERRTRCRTLVGGFGVPGLRDLDFGRNFVSYSEHLDWPEDVVVEEIPSSALLVLHRLQELRPDKLVIVVATSRGPDRPGTVRRYQLVDPSAVGAHHHTADAFSTAVDVHHSLALARQWGALPETVVIEVEPAETAVGLGFSEEVGRSLDRILALVRAELSGDRRPEGDGAVDQPAGGLDLEDELRPPGPGPVILRRGSSVRFGQVPHVDGLTLSARVHPGDPERRTGGDWYDVISLADGWTEVLVGEVTGQGLDAVATVGQLRRAARASSPADGRHPSRVLADLDRVVEASGPGEGVTAVCLAIHPRRGEVRMANAGHCPPLLCVADGPAVLCEQGSSAPLGAPTGHARTEASFSFPLDSILLLVSYGSVDGASLPTRHRMAELLVVAGGAPRDPEGLCDKVFLATQARLSPGEGGSLLAIRRAA